MSNLSYMDKLLDGVEVKSLALGDIGKFIRGNGIQKKDLMEAGFPAVHYGQIFTRYGFSAVQSFTFISDELAKKSRIAQKSDLLIATTSENDEDVLKSIAWLGEKVAISGDMMLFRHGQNVKYLAYYFQTEDFQKQKIKFITGAKVRRVSRDSLAKMTVSLPSLEVQAEIVRILDAFTELTAELTAELVARKQQYHYYRDQLLAFEEGKVKWNTLGEVAKKISSGGTPKTGVAEYWENGTIPWMSSGEVNLKAVYKTEKYISESGLKNSSAKIVPKNSIVIALAGQGTTRGKVARTRIDLTTNQSLAFLTFEETQINPDYVFYFLETQYENLRQISSGSGTRGGLNLKLISNYKIPIPPLTEQKRIAAILDKFDALTTSLTEGLPREIELRKEQYEYYRELLFSFPKVEVADHD